MTWRWLCVSGAVGTIAMVLGATGAQAQVINASDLMKLKDFERDFGGTLAPIYHGWERTDDGNVVMYFGYLNRNYKEVLDVPIGPNNFIEPGPQDHGQPTHFEQRLHRTIFRIVVPKDFKGQYVWTLSVRGWTETVKATLDPNMEVFFLHSPADLSRNTPPRITSIAPDQTVSQSQPATLSVTVEDDGLPTPRPAANGRPAAGLRVEWHKYRGPGQVTFANRTPPISNGVATTTATFSAPGVYQLQAFVDDGSRTQPTSECCWTTKEMTVTVNPDTSAQKP